MKQLSREKKFKSDLRRASLSNSQFQKFVHYLHLLMQNKELPPEAKDHSLKGEYKDTREFHLGGDMLVIYMVTEDEVILIRLGTHAQLFK